MSHARRRSSTTRFAVKLLLVVVLVCTAVYLGLLLELQRTLDQRLLRLHAAGVPKTWTEVAPPPVPDEDNAALIYWQAIKQLNLSRSERREVLSSNWGVSSASDAMPVGVQEILNRNRRALALICEAADKPRFHLAGDWDITPFKTPPAVTWFAGDASRCSALLRADAAMATEQGRNAEAVDAWGRCMRISEQVGSGGFPLWPTSVEIRIMTLATLQATLVHTEPDAQTCRALLEELGRSDLRAAYRKAAVTSILTTLWWFDAAERDPAQFGVFRGRYSRLRPSSWTGKIYLSPLGRLIRLGEEVGFVDVLQESLSLTERPYRDSAGGYAALRRRLKRAPPCYLITRELGSGIIHQESLAWGYDRVRALQCAMQVALALKAYHATRGTYPDSLTALREYPAWKLPEDPFSGKAFAYKRTGRGFILYSWGADLDDDGGREVAQTSGGDDTPPDGDLVWRFEK
jgi:hypothetical protein